MKRKDSFLYSRGDKLSWIFFLAFLIKLLVFNGEITRSSCSATALSFKFVPVVRFVPLIRGVQDLLFALNIKNEELYIFNKISVPRAFL